MEYKVEVFEMGDMPRNIEEEEPESVTVFTEIEAARNNAREKAEQIYNGRVRRQDSEETDYDCFFYESGQPGNVAVKLV